MGIYVCIWLIHFIVQQKLTQYFEELYSSKDLLKINKLRGLASGILRRLYFKETGSNKFRVKCVERVSEKRGNLVRELVWGN